MEAKALYEDLGSPGFTPSLAKPEMLKEVGYEERAYTLTRYNESGTLAGEVKMP